MPSTRPPGITVNAASHRTIDKGHRGVRIFARLGPVTEEEAQHRLSAEMYRVEWELQRKAIFRPRFADGATRYLQESRDRSCGPFSIVRRAHTATRTGVHGLRACRQ